MTGTGRLAPAVLLALAGALALASPAPAEIACAPERVTVLPDESAPRQLVYAVEIADEPAEQARGLMFRQTMPRDHGMLFVFPELRQASFWMRNTILPLDMIFIRDDGTVANVAENTVPFSERPVLSEGVVRAVLEVNAGEAARHGIGPGARVVHEAFEAAPAAFACPD